MAKWGWGDVSPEKTNWTEHHSRSDVVAEVRRAARYQMYRKWVYARYGKLGKGIRIRVPPCVVEHIRARFREPNCKCKLGGELFRCTEHGYVGHHDAPVPAAEE